MTDLKISHQVVAQKELLTMFLHQALHRVQRCAEDRQKRCSSEHFNIEFVVDDPRLCLKKGTPEGSQRGGVLFLLGSLILQ